MIDPYGSVRALRTFLRSKESNYAKPVPDLPMTTATIMIIVANLAKCTENERLVGRGTWWDRERIARSLALPANARISRGIA